MPRGDREVLTPPVTEQLQWVKLGAAIPPRRSAERRGPLVGMTHFVAAVGLNWKSFEARHLPSIVFREESGGAVGVHGTEAVKEFVDDGAGIRDLLALLDALVDQGYKCAG